MTLTRSAPQTPAVGTGARPGFDRTLLVVLIVVIIVAGVVVVVATALFIGPALSVTTKNIAPYSSSVSKNSNSLSSLTVMNTNGAVTVSTWSQPYLMINGTVTARGIGANPDTITFVESNSSGSILFEAVFPPGAFFFSTGYTVDINVYTPATAQFKSVQLTNVNGNMHVSTISASTVSLTDTNGKLSASGITSSTLTLTDTNGSIDFTCTFCNSVTATTTNGSVAATLTSSLTTGSITLNSTNGSINLKLPVSGSSFRITPTTTYGSVSGTGVSVGNHTTTIIGSGTAVVNLTTTNGSITVTGT